LRKELLWAFNPVNNRLSKLWKVPVLGCLFRDISDMTNLRRIRAIDY